MDPTNTYVVLDMRSGTFFGADDACLIDTAKLSPTELEDLNEGTDTDRLQIADDHGEDLFVLSQCTGPKQPIYAFLADLADDDERLATLEDFIVNHLGDN